MDEIKNEGDKMTPSDSQNIVSPDKGKGNSSDKNNPPKKSDLNTIFAGTIAVVTTIYVIISILQWISMREAIGISQKSLDWADSTNQHTKESLMKTDSSIELSKQIAVTQEKFAKIETRAYVIINKLRPPDIFSNKELTIYFEITNTGKTPASHMLVDARLAQGNDKVIEKAINGDIDKLKNGIAIHPNEGWVLGANVVANKTALSSWILQKEDSTSIVNNRIQIAILILIRYFDIFGEKHWTEGCFLFNPQTKDYYNFTQNNQSN